jgi:AbrB family looped-hinge helix DNA binding protein
MKSAVVNTNEKGQIVIPSYARKHLGITPQTSLELSVRDHGLYIHPITAVVRQVDSDHNSYPALLKKTQGSWQTDKHIRDQKKHKRELKASVDRKNAW